MKEADWKEMLAQRRARQEKRAGMLILLLL